jgi:hypothetical protein
MKSPLNDQLLAFLSEIASSNQQSITLRVEAVRLMDKVMEKHEEVLRPLGKLVYRYNLPS